MSRAGKNVANTARGSNKIKRKRDITNMYISYLTTPRVRSIVSIVGSLRFRDTIAADDFSEIRSYRSSQRYAITRRVEKRVSLKFEFSSRATFVFPDGKNRRRGAPIFLSQIYLFFSLFRSLRHDTCIIRAEIRRGLDGARACARIYRARALSSALSRRR